MSATVTLVRSDGKEATIPLPSAVRRPTSAIARTTWAPDLPALHFETTTGDQILAELPEEHDLAPRRGRPVIYLDQNHWSTLANSIHMPDKIQPSEREAAEHLITLARERKIILPMSAGHMSETCKWTNDDARYRLALTILQLSGGWQMRDPLDVRRFELRQAFTQRFKASCLLQRAVFTLEPDAIHGENRDRRGYEPPADLPERERFVLRAQVSVSGNFDTMLDSEPVEMGESPGWVTKLQRFTDWIATEPRDPRRRRQRIHTMFIGDLGNELAHAAYQARITPDQMSEWTITHSDADVQTLLSLGLFREVLHEKLLNPGTRWESNDLTDMMYLSCAAGYADHVVAEKSLTAHLDRGLRRLGRQARVHRRLADFAQAM